MKTILKICSFFSLIILISLFTSCEEPSLIGLDVQPESDKLNVKFVDTLTINAVSQREDSVRTDKVSLYLLGSINDPVFGFSNCSFTTEINLPSSNVVFPADVKVDSIVLTLYLKSFYGNDKYVNRMKVNVWEVTETLNVDSVRFSNQAVSKGQLLGSKTLIPNVKDSVLIDGVMFPPNIRIKLDNNLGKRFIEAAANGQLANNISFVEYFKGIHVEALPFNQGGMVYYIDLLNGFSRLSLYYNSPNDTGIFNFTIGQKCARFNTFTHDYSIAVSDLKNQMSDSNIVFNQKLYLQTRAGVKVHLNFPTIKNLVDPYPIIINKAELVLPIDETDVSSKSYPVPPRLVLATYNEKGEYAFLPDYSDPRFGGEYNKVKKEYRFNITRYVQDALRDGYVDRGLVIFISGSSARADRLVLSGTASTGRKPQLQISYTVIN